MAGNYKMHTHSIETPLQLEHIATTDYNDATDKIGQPINLARILRLIRDDTNLAHHIRELRRLYQQAESSGNKEDKVKYEEAKKSLLAFTVSGSFSRRGNDHLQTYSGILQMDFDHLKQKGVDIVELKDKISRDPHVVFAFGSPSGDGLKVGLLVATAAEEHAAAFKAAQQYCLQKYGILPDPKCGDLSRLCFLSSDPDIHINEEAVPFDWQRWADLAEAEKEGEESAGFVPLPLDAFPNTMQELAAEYAAVYQVDPALPAVSALTIFSAALGAAVECVDAVNGHTARANLFTGISAASGYGKNVCNRVALPLTNASNELGKHWDAFVKPELNASIVINEVRKKEIEKECGSGKSAAARKRELQAELAKLLSDNARFQFEIEHMPLLYTGSATGPALGQALLRNAEALLSFTLEGADAIRVAAGRFTADKRGDYDLFLSGYTGEPFSDARVSRSPIRLQKPCLSLLWCFQPSICQELYNSPEAQDRGFLARINLVQCYNDVTPMDDGVVRVVSPELEKKWDDLIRAALALRERGRTIKFVAERRAREIFRRWHNEAINFRNGPGREDESKLSRCRENAIRIALNIAAEEWLLAGGIGVEAPLTAEHAARGVVIAQYFLAQTLNATRNAATAKRQARLNGILELLRSNGGSMTFRILHHNHGIGEVELGQIVSSNPDKLRIEKREAGPSGGRPSTRLVAI
jgi:hypothetical protein